MTETFLKEDPLMIKIWTRMGAVLAGWRSLPVLAVLLGVGGFSLGFLWRCWE